MPGLCGFAGSLAADPSSEASLRGMVELLRHRPYQQRDALFGDGRVSATRCHLTSSNPPEAQRKLPFDAKLDLAVDSQRDAGLDSPGAAQPRVEGRLRIWLDGEFFNRDELRREFSGRDDAALLAAILRTGDFSRLDRIDGVYCAVAYDAEAAVVHLITDRHGLGYLYWRQYGGGLAWSSEQKAMLALPDFEPRLDRSSLESFMQSGQLRGERSWFEGVELLPPASVVSFDLHKRSSNALQYWTPMRIARLPAKVDESELIDELARRFRLAVERRARPGERLACNLSGGLDSRAVLAAIPEGARPVHALTFGTAQSPDLQLAARAAAVAGAEHHTLELSGEDWLRNRCAGVWWSDGQLSLLHMHGLGVEMLRPLCDVSLNGFVGDLVAGGSLLSQRTESDCEFDVIMNRGRRFTMQGIRLGRNFFDIRLPFMDNDLIDLLMSMPDSLRADSYLYKKMLLRHFPQYFRNIPWQKTGLPISSSALRVGAVQALRSWTQRGQRWLGRVGVAVSDRQTYADYPAWLRREKTRHFVEARLLDRQALYREYLPSADASTAWQAHLAGRDHSLWIGRLLSFEIWLQQTFEGRWRSREDDPCSES